MPPRGVKKPKRKRQYEHIKKSVMKRGRSECTAKRIAGATVNKTRREKGETKQSATRSKASPTKRKSAQTTGGRTKKSASRSKASPAGRKSTRKTSGKSGQSSSRSGTRKGSRGR